MSKATKQHGAPPAAIGGDAPSAPSRRNQINHPNRREFPMPTTESSITELSFVADRYGPSLRGHHPGRCFWNVQGSDDYGKDCNLGTRLALEFLDYEETNEGCSILQWIVGDMPRPLTGIEIGFLTLVSFSAGAGAHEGRRISAYWDKCREEEAQAKKKRRDRSGRFVANSDLQSAG